MVNPERGEIEIQSGTDRYTFRLGLTALAKLQKLLSTPERRMPISEIVEKCVALEQSGDDVDLEFLLLVMLAGLQQYHSATFTTKEDVAQMIERAGGLAGLYTQLTGLRESLTPDPEDQKRRAANPRRARAKR